MGFNMDYLTTREPEEMSLSAYKKHAKRQGAELLCNTVFVYYCVVVPLGIPELTGILATFLFRNDHY